MSVFCEHGSDCLWVVTEANALGQCDRRAFYPWESDDLAHTHANAEWLPAALAHLASIPTGVEE